VAGLVRVAVGEPVVVGASAVRSRGAPGVGVGVVVVVVVTVVTGVEAGPGTTVVGAVMPGVDGSTNGSFEAVLVVGGAVTLRGSTPRAESANSVSASAGSTAQRGSILGMM
jgi:hypothetical protein